MNYETDKISDSMTLALPPRAMIAPDTVFAEVQSDFV